MSDGPLMTLTQLAHMLGVTTNQVYTWHQRRERNGFPERAGDHPRRAGAPLFSGQQVMDWFIAYEPSKGGRKRAA